MADGRQRESRFTKRRAAPCSFSFSRHPHKSIVVTMQVKTVYLLGLTVVTLSVVLNQPTMNKVELELAQSTRMETSRNREKAPQSAGEPKNAAHEQPAQHVNAHDTLNFIILIVISNGHLDFLANWWTYYARLNLPNEVVVVAQDEASYAKLSRAKLPVTLERSELDVGSGGPLTYRIPDYDKFVSQRPKRILQALREGRNVLHVDADSVWLSNPFVHMKDDASIDIWAQDERNKRTEKPRRCAGFMAFRSTPENIELAERWSQKLETKAQSDQHTINAIIRTNPRVQDLDYRLFPQGKQFFEDYDDAQRSEVVVVHNNYIVGHDPKVERFKRLDLWHPDEALMALSVSME